MKLKFKTLDEVNAFLLKDMTPLEYCKMVIADTINEIQEYLTAGRKSYFNALYFFADRQCGIRLKDNTLIVWSIEMTFEQVVLPNIDEIEYVDFYSIPWKVPCDFDGFRFGSYCDLGREFCDLQKPVNYGYFYRFDSVHGAYLYGEAYHNSDAYKQQRKSISRKLFRDYLDYQVVVYKKGKEHYTYYANFTDACIGAYVAEQILLSNQQETRSLDYGIHLYKSKAVHLFPLSEHNCKIYQKEFWDHAHEECGQIIHKIYRSLSRKRRTSFDFHRNTVIAEFIYMFIHSLRWHSVADNFTVLFPVFCSHLKNNTSLKQQEKAELTKELCHVCHAHYFGEQPVSNPTTFLEQFQAAVWALVNSSSYMDAIKNILNHVDFRHECAAAVILTGAFAGIYYQHYRIPYKYMTGNRYYSHFSKSIIPYEKIEEYFLSIQDIDYPI